MKLLSSLGSALSLMFVAVALFKLRSVALFRADVAVCIWAFASALGLTFGVYFVYLRNRIAELEKRLTGPE
jgi:hypothetical protein